MKRKCTSLMLSVVLIISALFAGIIVPADEVNASTSHSQSEAVAWANARVAEGWAQDVDGAYGCQCVDLILAYYTYLGVSRSSGNAVDYASNQLPSGWTRVTSPQAGDIVVWGPGAALSQNSYADATFGHIGIVTEVLDSNSIRTVETNTSAGSAAHSLTRYSNTARCYIRPDWALWYQPYGSLHIGEDFYARIMLNSKIAVTVDAADNWNVENADMSDENIRSAKYLAQYWHFIRNDDRSYRILNTYYDDRPLIATGQTSGSNAKLGVPAYFGDAGQKWFFYDPNSYGPGYYIVRNGASQFVLNVHNQGFDPGTNLQIWNYTNSGAEHFLIEKHTPAGASTLSVTPGFANENTRFTWTSASGEVKWYDLKLSKLDSSGNVETFYDNDYLSGSLFNKELPEGNYKAQIISHSAFNAVEGNTVTFTVEKKQSGSSESGGQNPSGNPDAGTSGSDTGIPKTEDGNMASGEGASGSDVSSLAPAAGSTITAEGQNYEVLSASAVSFTKSANKKSVFVPETVLINGKKYNVTRINANAFKGSKIRSITIGKNVIAIKAYAFKGSKATKLILKTKKLTKKSVKNCLKGSKIKSVQVKAGKKARKNYKKIFVKKIVGKKVKVK